MVKAICGFGAAAVVAAMTAIAIIFPVELLEPYKVWVVAAMLFVFAALLVQTALQIRDDGQEKRERQLQTSIIEEMHRKIFSAASPAYLEPQNSILESDPRLYPEFLDERGSTYLHKKTAILIHNRGGSNAHDVSIETIPLRGNSVSFPLRVGFVPPMGNARFEPRMEGRWGLFSQNFVRALVDEWNTYKDVNRKTLELPLRIVYRNFAGTAMFETRCNIILDPLVEVLPRTYGAPHNGRPVIRFSNPEFRKVIVQPKATS